MKKLWKIYKYFALTVFTVFLVDLVVVIGVSLYKPEIKRADAVVILGAAINTPALYNRSLEGLRVYENGGGEVLVLSGGKISNKDISEAEYMRRVIEKNYNNDDNDNTGSKPEELNLILEEDSHNTYENIKNTKEKIPGAKSLVVVSDRFHLARAVLVAKRMGFEDVYWSSPSPKYYKTSELIFYYFREAIAMIDYIPKFIFN